MSWGVHEKNLPLYWLSHLLFNQKNSSVVVLERYIHSSRQQLYRVALMKHKHKQSQSCEAINIANSASHLIYGPHTIRTQHLYIIYSRCEPRMCRCVCVCWFIALTSKFIIMNYLLCGDGLSVKLSLRQSDLYLGASWGIECRCQTARYCSHNCCSVTCMCVHRTTNMNWIKSERLMVSAGLASTCHTLIARLGSDFRRDEIRASSA